jgi:competence protein ComFC
MKYAFMRQALHGLAHLFYPESCEGCNNELNANEKVLCLHCSLLLPRTSFHHIQGNKAFQNFIGRVPIEKATSFVFFTKEGLMQHLLHRFKYKGRKEIGTYLGRLLGEELKKCGWLDNIDIIIPVPLHARKEYSRGYNQAQVFAEGIATATGIAVWNTALLRVKNTETQTRKTRAERVENVRNVFKLREPKKLKNKRILLVDDVLTTGATLEACAIELLKAEGVQVSIATIALATD